jgi:hypothetical protein
MALQNRVTPFSTIEAVPARGLFMGNRGILHNERHELVSQGWRTKRWIICELSFKDWHREVMQPHHYTELFFLDEAVALAAGHRPCALCRAAAFEAFTAAWSQGKAGPASALTIDEQLHCERVPALRGKGRRQAELATQPDGAMVMLPCYEGEAWLKLGTWLYGWSHMGYRRVEHVDGAELVGVLTPFSTVCALRNGYRPYIHPSVYDLQVP